MGHPPSLTVWRYLVSRDALLTIIIPVVMYNIAFLQWGAGRNTMSVRLRILLRIAYCRRPYHLLFFWGPQEHQDVPLILA